MKQVLLTARTDIEIHDEVLLLADGIRWQVYDIRMIHCLRDQVIFFEYLLKRGDHFTVWLKRDEFVYPV